MHWCMLTQVGTIAEMSLVFSFRYDSSSSNALSLVVASRFDTFFRITNSSAFKWAEEAIGSESTDGEDDRAGRAMPATEGLANCANPPRSWKLRGLLPPLPPPESSAARLQVVNGCVNYEAIAWMVELYLLLAGFSPPFDLGCFVGFPMSTSVWSKRKRQGLVG